MYDVLSDGDLINFWYEFKNKVVSPLGGRYTTPILMGLGVLVIKIKRVSMCGF